MKMQILGPVQANVVYLFKTLRVNKTEVVTMSFEYEYTIQLFQVTSSDDE